MAKPAASDAALLALFRAIAARDERAISRALESSPELARRAIHIAATRQDAQTYFLTPISHYVYGGDTALHLAAASYQPELAESLVERGAVVRARNRRGAEPLHYAADGGPDAQHWDPAAQRRVIEYLVSVGADPDALDNSGVAPLHRAVRSRGSAAVRALVEHGADFRLMNQRGSTPLHLAVQNTGRSNSGSQASKDEQRRVISLLLGYGASATDVDGKGKSARDAATSDWIRDLLDRA